VLALYADLAQRLLSRWICQVQRKASHDNGCTTLCTTVERLHASKTGNVLAGRPSPSVDGFPMSLLLCRSLTPMLQSGTKFGLDCNPQEVLRQQISLDITWYLCKSSSNHATGWPSEKAQEDMVTDRACDGLVFSQLENVCRIDSDCGLGEGILSFTLCLTH